MNSRPSPPRYLLLRLLHSIEGNGIRGAVVRSYRRLFRSLQSHGLSGTLERAFLKAPAPAARAVTPQPHPFDRLHGTDTGGLLSGLELGVSSLSAAYITIYLGVPPSTLRAFLSELPVGYEDYSFVDIGCGKGRALLVAAEFPFRRLVGVEIASALCDVARANVALKQSWQERISIVNQDATRFVLPEGPLLLYLYHPFLAPILRRFLKNLQRAVRGSRRPVFLVYVDVSAEIDADAVCAGEPKCQEAMKAFPMIRLISDKAYRLSEEDAAADSIGTVFNRFTVYSVEAGG